MKLPEGTSWRNYKRKAETPREKELLDYIESLHEENTRLEGLVNVLCKQVNTTIKQIGEILELNGRFLTLHVENRKRINKLECAWETFVGKCETDEVDEYNSAADWEDFKIRLSENNDDAFKNDFAEEIENMDISNEMKFIEAYDALMRGEKTELYFGDGLLSGEDNNVTDTNDAGSDPEE